MVLLSYYQIQFPVTSDTFMLFIQKVTFASCSAGNEINQCKLCNNVLFDNKTAVSAVSQLFLFLLFSFFVYRA